MPKDLKGMYRRVFDEMTIEERENTCRMLAIVIAAARTLTIIEFYHALVYSTARVETKASNIKSVNTKLNVHLPLE